MLLFKFATHRIDLMHRRHHAAMLGVQPIALYALVICDWHISDNCVILLTPKGHEIMTSYALGL